MPVPPPRCARRSGALAPCPLAVPAHGRDGRARVVAFRLSTSRYTFAMCPGFAFSMSPSVVFARLDRAIPYSRDSSERVERPRRTGSRLKAGTTANVWPRTRQALTDSISRRSLLDVVLRRPGPIITDVFDERDWSSDTAQQLTFVGMGPGLRRDDTEYVAAISAQAIEIPSYQWTHLRALAARFARGVL